MADDDNRPHSPPWMFAFPYLAYGIVGGFAGIALPNWARNDAHVSLDTIGWFTLITFFPPILQFLYAPVVDIGMGRQKWLLLVAFLGAACLFGACLMPLPSHLGWLLALVVAAQAISGLIGSCTGGMLAATMPDHARGKASGWLNAGNLGGNALGGSIAIYLKQVHAAPVAIGVTLAGLMILPSLMALAMVDGPRASQPGRELFTSMLRDVARVLRSRRGWTGILFCLSPVGTAALVNLYAGMPRDFHMADDDPTVVVMTGPVSLLLTAIGSLVGGALCDRYNRRAMYLLSGVLTAACGIAMLGFPLDRANFVLGFSAYLLVSGLCYAAFYAVVLEAIGRAGAAASTEYTLFSSAGNLAIAYVAKLDTVFVAHGPKAPLATDAVLNLAGVAVLAALLLGLRRRGGILEA